MSTALVPLADMERMAAAIAASGLFGMKRKEEALALMIVAQAENRHPGSVAAEYHIIQGRPALKADAMLARFQDAGGVVKWLAYTDEAVSAEFSHAQGGTVMIDWNMDRAKKAGLTGKDNWNKYPRQMLRARVISEGVRTCFPRVASGVYTPEEVRDMPPEREINPRPKRYGKMPEAPVEDVQPVRDPDDAALRDLEQNAAAPQTTDAGSPPLSGAGSPAAGAAAPCINADQHIALMDALKPIRNGETRFLHQAGLERLTLLPASEYCRAMAWCDAALEADRKGAKK